MKKALSFILVLIFSLFTLTACNGQSDNGDNTHTEHTYQTLKFDNQNHWYECDCGDKQNVELHNGGTATCAEKAVCEICNTKYGNLQEHDYQTLKFNEQNHWYECVCGDKQNVELHNGGTATCTEKAICEICNTEYGNLQDHKYQTLKFNEQNHWHECVCGDKQNKESHRGGTATCTEKAVCEICNIEYGTLKNHSYQTIKYDSQNHWYECVCGKKQGEELHRGGTATTTSKAVCEICNQEYGSVLLFKREGKYVYFGRYIQSIKPNNVTVSKFTNGNGYYVGSDGGEYLKLQANASYYYDDATFSDGTPIIKGTYYYFKLEPLRWEIIDEEKGLLLCDRIIENMRYANDISNNYKNSKVRAWLNDYFLNFAFTKEEQAFIKTTLVDNSPESTLISPNKFACENTEDKIFLLSAVEAKAMNVNNYYFPMELQRVISDFSRATGCEMDVWLNYGCGRWYTRSPFANKSNQVRVVLESGKMENRDVHNERIGIVPALRIDL